MAGGAVVLFVVAAPPQATIQQEQPASKGIVPSLSTKEAAQARSDPALLSAINQVIEQSDAAQARWGVFVMSLNDSRVLCSRDGERLFTPASNMKIFTTSVAL